jgi:hypothetical protein
LTVEVRYLGHLGNNLFEYALGRILAEELGLAMQCLPASDIPMWSDVERMSGIVDRLGACCKQFADVPQSLPGKEGEGPQLRYVMGEKHGWTGHSINLDYLLSQGQGRRIVLHGYFQRVEYYHRYAERIRRWYRFRDERPVVALQPQDVVVHLRQSIDMFLLDRAIDLAFYRDLLGGMSLGRVYVCGLGIDSRVKEVFAPFRPVYLDLSAVDTLRFMTHANRIVLANSTFSWWGAYLSEASEIYFPRLVRNFWGKDLTDVNLEVPEARYRYIDDVPVLDWQPFHPNPRRRMNTTVEADVARITLQGCGQRDGDILIPPSLAAFGEWLSLRSEPFGINDLYALEIPERLRHAAMQLLFTLCTHGALHADEKALEAIAHCYGIKRK